MKHPIDNSIPAQIARHEHELGKIDELHGERCLALARDPDNGELRAEAQGLESERAERLAHIERLRKASAVETSLNTRDVKLAALALQKQRPAAYLKLTDETAEAIEAAIAYIHGLGPLLARIQVLQAERQSIAAAGLRAGAAEDYVKRYASRAGLASCEPTVAAALANAFAAAGVGRTRPSLDPYVSVSAPSKAPDVAVALRKYANDIVTTIDEFIQRDEQELAR